MRDGFTKRWLRAAGIGVTVLAAALSTSTARAGTYVVHYCGGYNQWQGWTPLGADGPSSFIKACSSSAHGDGLRAQANAGTFGRSSTVAWSFKAPAGTWISSVKADVGSSETRDQSSAAWTRGIFNPDASSSTSDIRWLASVREESSWQRVVSTPHVSVKRVAIGLECSQASCDVNSAEWVAARNIEVELADQRAPEVTVVQPPRLGWRHGAEEIIRVTANDDVSGVSWFYVRLNGRHAADLIRRCYEPFRNLEVRPCWSAEPLQWEAAVDLSHAPDGPNKVLISVSDAATNVTERSYTVLVDHHPPAAPRLVAAAGGGQWTATNRFSIRWANPREIGVAPIDAAVIELCPAVNDPYDDSGCVTTVRSGDDIDHVDDLDVPGPGSWRLRLSLRDAAGNISTEIPSVTGPLRFDDVPPSGAFLALDPRDPARLRFVAVDSVSAIAKVEIAARRHGDTEWQELEVAAEGGEYTAAIDDAILPPGMYEFRAHVTDLAGNDSTVTGLADGTMLTAHLPVRAATKLLVGQLLRVPVKNRRGTQPRYRRVLVKRPRPSFGREITLEGRLTDEAGNPRSDAPIDVYERVRLPGKDWRFMATITTSPSGTFEWRAMAGPARELRFAYLGDRTTRPRIREVDLAVRAGVTLMPSKRRVRNGEEVVFRGRLLGGPLPRTGKLLTLQARTRRGWLTFANPRARAADGHWSYRYRFTGTSITSRYAFRVLVPEDSSYPYSAGKSKVVRVLVQGNR